jgi:hypothetical protein
MLSKVRYVRGAGAELRDVPMEYVLAIREHLDQKEKEANQEGSAAVGHRAR